MHVQVLAVVSKLMHACSGDIGVQAVKEEAQRMVREVLATLGEPQHNAEAKLLADQLSNGYKELQRAVGATGAFHFANQPVLPNPIPAAPVYS